MTTVDLEEEIITPKKRDIVFYLKKITVGIAFLILFLILSISIIINILLYDDMDKFRSANYDLQTKNSDVTKKNTTLIAENAKLTAENAKLKSSQNINLGNDSSQTVGDVITGKIVEEGVTRTFKYLFGD